MSTQEQLTPTVQGVNFRSELAGEGDASFRLRQTGVCEEAAAMFAPLVAKAKSTGPQPAKAVDQTHTPRPSLGDQATSSFVAPQPSRTGSAPGAKTTGSNAARAAGQGTARSWDFSKISLHPSGLAEQPQTSSLHWPPRLPIQAKLKVGAVDDPLEHEADRVADQVMRMPAPEVAATQAPLQINRKCAACEEEEKLQKKEAVPAAPALSEAPPSVHAALRSPGEPLDAATSNFMESRFHYNFGSVRIHSDERAAESARALHALGYTVGRNVVFGAGQYSPKTAAGRHLLAHELTHVIQQQAAPSAPVVQRQESTGIGDDADSAAEREYGDSGAPKAVKCGAPSHCPAGFCDPYRSQKLAEYYRAKNGPIYLAGISAFVDSRVVPFWREYLQGGSDPKNITADFAKDFTNSPTTKKTTSFLVDGLQKALTAKPPSVAASAKSSVDIATLIPTAIAALDDPNSKDKMNFNVPSDIPGNLAGGIGKDQKACPAGAKPSPFNDERHASGTVEVTRGAGASLVITPSITYTVRDTIDLCPGDCGSVLEQVATVPLSQFEATGISGDVPFTVVFPAPPVASFTITAPPPSSTGSSPAPAPPPTPKPAPKGV
jgi:Domain of unknown function (DUF4157)